MLESCECYEVEISLVFWFVGIEVMVLVLKKLFCEYIVILNLFLRLLIFEVFEMLFFEWWFFEIVIIFWFGIIFFVIDIFFLCIDWVFFVGGKKFVNVFVNNFILVY